MRVATPKAQVRVVKASPRAQFSTEHVGARPSNCVVVLMQVLSVPEPIQSHPKAKKK